MSKILWFAFLFSLFHEVVQPSPASQGGSDTTSKRWRRRATPRTDRSLNGNTEAECDASDGTTVKCKFSKDISSTRTNFVLYFIYDNDKSEMLADCLWDDGNLKCLETEGVKLKQPVSDVAEIMLPVTSISRPGKYGCTTDTSSNENIKFCRFFSTQSKVEQDNPKRVTYQSRQKKNDFDMVAAFIGPSVCLAGLILIGTLIWLKNVLKKVRDCKRHKCSYGRETVPLMPVV